MPRLPQPTAQGRQGILSLPQPSARQFGLEAFGELSEFGKTLHDIGEKIQDNQDKLDLIKVSGDYAIEFDQAQADVLKHPDLTKHGELLRAKSAEIHHQLLGKYPSLSSAVKTTFQQHVAKSVAPATIDVAHQGRALAIERQIVEVGQLGEQMAATYGREPIGRAVIIEGVANARHTLGTMATNGTIHPKAAQAIQDGWANVFWEQRAISAPQFTQHVAQTGRHGPDDFQMDPHKSAYYHNLAQAQINETDKARAGRKAEELDKVKSELLSDMWGKGRGAGGARDMSAEIEVERNTLGANEFQKMMTDNLNIQNASKQFTLSGGERRISEYVQSDLLDKAKRAKYEPGLLKSVINFDVVRSHVFKKADLHPDDAAPIYEAISAAMAHHESGDSTLRKAQTDAMKSLEVYVPQLATATDAFTLKNIQDSMQRQLRVELERKPDATSVEVHQLADTIRAQGELRVLSAQRLTMQQVDQELFGMERHWQALDPGLVGTTHDLKPAARTQLEKQFPMLKGLFKLHDARRERWEHLTKVGEDQAARSAGKK